MRALLFSSLAVVILLVGMTGAAGKSGRQDYTDLYRANRKGGKQSSSRSQEGSSSSSADPRSLSKFIHGANDALEKVLAYSGFLESTDPAIPASQKKGALLKTQESLFAAAHSMLVTQHRARDPQAAQAAAMRQKKDGSVGFAEDVKGMLGITSPIDQEGEAFLARQGDGQQLDEIETATKTFADALVQNGQQHDKDRRREPSVATGVPTAVKGFPKVSEQLKEVNRKVSQDSQDEVAPGISRQQIQQSMAYRPSSTSSPKPSGIEREGEQETASRGRSFDTQATVNGTVVNATVLYENVPDNFCREGAVAVPNTTVFTCDANGTVTTGVTSGAFLALTPEQQANCSFPAGTSVQCVCPLDGFLGTGIFGATTCYGRRVTCETQITSPNLEGCPTPSINDDFAAPVCYSISRSTTSTITVESNTTCGFLYTSPDAYLAVGVTVEEISSDVQSLSMITLPALNFKEDEIITPASGTYLELQERSFNYLAGPTFTTVGSDATAETPQKFAVTANHPVVTQGQFFAEIYNFNKLSDRSGLKQTSVKSLGLASQLVGNVTTWQYAVEGITDGHIAGGRMYMEVGLEGGIIGVGPIGVSAKGFTIDISDAPVPAARGGVRGLALNLIILICIVVGVALIVGAIMAFRWYRKKDQKSLDLEEEY